MRLCECVLTHACAAARATWPKYFNLKFVKIAHQEAFSGRLRLLFLLTLRSSRRCSREMYTHISKRTHVYVTYALTEKKYGWGVLNLSTVPQCVCLMLYLFI